MTTALPERLLARDVLDFADARVIDWLAARIGDGTDAAQAEAFTRAACALCLARTEGNLGLPLDVPHLADFVRRTLEGGLDASVAADAEALAQCTRDAEESARTFLAALDAGRYDAVVGPSGSGKPLVRTETLLAFHRDWFAERTVADRLLSLCADAARPSVPDDDLAGILREILKDRPLRGRDGNPLELTARQREALETALRTRVFVLAGGPGTGKTTWTAAWLRAYLRLPGSGPARVRLCAPTGRAARRLEESLRATLAACADDPRDAAAAGMRVTTLHALLGWNAHAGRFARTEDDPLDTDVVLLDEASMADVHLMAALLRALPSSARLVLAGDPGQLPAVEAGAVLDALLPESGVAPGPIPSVTLDDSHRATGAVIPLAAAIRSGDGNAVLELLGSPVEPAMAFAGDRALTRTEPADETAGARAATERLEELLRAYADSAFGRNTASGYANLLERFRTLPREAEPAALEVLWERVGRTRVLAPLRKGPVSTESANRLLRKYLEPAWRRPTDGRDPGGFHGAPVLVTRNDARTGLSNGDLGLWLETGDGTMVFFPRPELPGGWLRLPAALLPSYEPGFATTVHKSQGSECDEVLVLLPPAGNRLLARETLYTAITRARVAVKIFGSEAAVREAVERRLERRGALRDMLAKGGWPGTAQG